MTWYALDVGHNWREIRECQSRPKVLTRTIQAGARTHSFMSYVGGTSRAVVPSSHIRALTGRLLRGSVSRLTAAEAQLIIAKG